MRENSVMKIVKKIVVWFLGAIAALALALIGLHLYYRLTPVELSDEAKSLLKETAHMAQLTENGYRMQGLEAPEKLDPVTYGKCRIEAGTKQMTGIDAISEVRNESKRETLLKPISDAYVADVALCLQGGKEFRLGDWQLESNRFHWKPDFDWSRLKSLPTNAPVVVRNRWEQVLQAGTRGHIPDLSMSAYSIPRYQHPLAIEQAKLTEFANAWDAAADDAARMAALKPLNQSVANLARFGDGILIDTMITLAAHSRQLLVIQAAAAKQPALRSELAEQMSEAIAPIQAAPTLLAKAIGAEVQGSRSISDGMALGRYDNASYAPAFFNILGRFGFDRNDTLNIFAMGYRDAQKNVLAKRSVRDSASRVYAFAENIGCPSLGDWAWYCLAFERNPTGKLMAAIAIPAYDDYGLRAHDVVNLSAATRLTIEARRRGLQSEALAQFVANAPEGMRDVYSGKPFAYDALKKQLTIELHTKSTVLGEKSYELSL
jgi:hypothetical protein